ncbi:MAG: 4-hydroxy-tetrahydrodipicolinate reductase [Opitutales bacterium]|nr:4-hydroxy-tetrahydrodipicolinate reductase [Opitutales bacterium]
MSLNILLCGAGGRMGQAISSISQEHGCTISFPVDLDDDPADGIESCDVVIDFSLREATLPLARLSSVAGKPMVIGTTGHGSEEKAEIEALSSKIPMVWAGNFSTGVNLLFYLTEQAARVLDDQSDFDPEVIEMHHRLKKDAPSGTADRLLEILKDSRKLGADQVAHGRSGIVGERPAKEIGSHALRGGDVVGDHTVLFAGIGERIELTHRASDRKIFAAGALRAAKWVGGRSPGLYSMQDVLGLSS